MAVSHLGWAKDLLKNIVYKVINFLLELPNIF